MWHDGSLWLPYGVALCLVALSFVFLYWPRLLMRGITVCATAVQNSASILDTSATQLRNPRNEPPVAPVLPFWGSTTALKTQGMEFATPLHARLGPIFTTWILGDRTVVVGSLDLVRKLFASEHELVEGDWPKSTYLLLGTDSVSGTKGDAHMRLRKILNPAFTAKAVAVFVPQIVDIAQRCCAAWLQQGRVSGFDKSKEYTFLVALEVILGFKKDAVDDALLTRCREAFRVWLQGLFSVPVDLPGFAFHRARKADRLLRGILHSNLQHLKDEAEHPAAGGAAGGAARPRTCAQNLLDVRDDDGQPLSMGQLNDVNMTLLFAGHDTSSATIMQLFIALSTHPRCVAKLRAEQEQVQAKLGAEITEAALRAMPYAEACIKEALRINPIVSTIYRKALQDLELGGHRIPKGRRILINMWQVLRSDERFAGKGGDDGPHSFCPERWMADDAQRAGAWIPFGGPGPRFCLGWILAMAEIKILLAVLARGSEFPCVLDPEEEMEPYPLPFPKAGLMMDFRAPAPAA